MKATPHWSARDFEAEAGVSHQKANEWRTWYNGGADPETLPPPQKATIRKLQSFLGRVRDIEVRRAALQLAATRLEMLAAELRREAATGEPSGPDASGADSLADAIAGPKVPAARRKTARAHRKP